MQDGIPEGYQRRPKGELITRSSRLLAEMYDEPRGLFAYSTRINGDGYQNDFTLAGGGVDRYTINSLLGIERAQYHHAIEGWDLPTAIERYLRTRRGEVSNPADLGLLLRLLVAVDHDSAHEVRDAVIKFTANPRGLLLSNLQELCWMALGLISWSQRYGNGEEDVQMLMETISRHFRRGNSPLPDYNLSTLRRGMTSFGGVAYYLMALGEYGDLFGDNDAKEEFARGVKAAIALQGEQGEWPWFIDTKRKRVLDWYQIYSVHQDAMAMLFLLPAKDAGIEGATTAIEKSYRWLFGENELGTSMISERPFFIYRSLRRRESGERARRYLRSIIGQSAGRRADPSQLEINDECRSYHIGWILYAWSGRKDFPEFTDLQFAQG